MKILNPADEAVTKILGPQKIKDIEYRPLSFLVEEAVPSGKLIYNLLTKELLLLENGEEQREELISRWFYVPKTNDDRQLCGELRELARVYKMSQGITGYTILTTTECNARCPYCYEKDYRRVTMTEKTARDVVSFIRRECKADKVSLNWFGGEPLFNSKVIDIICQGLSDYEYKSTMISNGYLFDDDMVNRAVNCWHLKRVQITLDGTEEVYNRTKGYIYRDGSSPFQRILDNIGRLLDAGVRVVIRLNLSDKNFDDLLELSDLLIGKFSGCKNLHIYAAVLYQLIGQKEFYQMRETLNARFASAGLSSERGKLSVGGVRTNGCMMDNDSCILIAPSGALGKCEHFFDTEACGSIYDGITRPDIVERYKKCMDLPECAECVLYPLCVPLASCPISHGVCMEENRKSKLDAIRASMLDCCQNAAEEETAGE